MLGHDGGRRGTAEAPAPGAEAPFHDDAARAKAARRLAPGIEGNPAVDRMTQLAARLLGVDAAQVSVIGDVQVVAGSAGSAPPLGAVSATQDSLCRVVVADRTPLVVADATLDERVSELPPVRSGAVRSCLGVPLTADDGHPIGALCVYDRLPRTWMDSDVALLQQLGAAVEAELELAALTAEYESDRLVWQLAVDAAGVGAFDWNLRTGELRWDDRLLELFGLDRGSFGGTIDAFNAAVHDDDLDRVSSVIEEAVATCGEYAAEYRVVLPDGRLRWVAARGKVVPGGDGVAARMVGAAYDTTAVQEGEARVARVLETMPTAFFQLDREWRFRYVNAEAARLLGASRDELVGGVLWKLFPAAVGSDFEANYRRSAETGEPVTFDAFYPAPLDAWYEVRAWPSPDGLAVYFVDITERRAAQEAAQQAAQRSALLAAVTAELTGTLDAVEAVSRLAALVTPVLADWCVVTLVDDAPTGDWRRRLRDVGAWHAVPEMRPVLDRYRQLRIAALTDASFVASALTAGEPVVVDGDTRERVSAVLADPEAQALFRTLDPHAAAVIPLRGRERTVGLLSVFRGADRGQFRSAELDTLGEVAARAGLALDNARLFAQQRDLAEGLQRSMLTAPPEPDHLKVAVRYEAAARAAQVGGDWYDSFLVPGGATVLVIGDVVGHDTAAAAAMGQLRNLLRGVAVHTGDGPARVLRGVDEVLATLRMDTTATAVVARIEQPRSRTEATELRWSNAGHPPPMLIQPDGRVDMLMPGSADLLLGLQPTARRAESAVGLTRGSTVLLYTDGLVERRDQSLDEGLQHLRATLAELARQGLTLEEMCDQVLERMLPPTREDDVALVAVRLNHDHT